MSLLKNNTQLLALLSLFVFLFFWQKSALVSFFLLPIYLAFFLEFFSFLKLRKDIIKEATMIKNTFIYRMSARNFYIHMLSFFLALFGLFSLFLHLISLKKQDTFFLFILLPLFLLFFKQKFQAQFFNNAYNDFRIIILISFILALLYAIFNLCFNHAQAFSLTDFSQSIVHYKNSNFFVFDFISELLTLIGALREYLLYSLGLFWFHTLHFVFDFTHFFIFSSFMAYLYNFAFKIQKKSYVLMLSCLMSIFFSFHTHSKNEHIKSYQEELILVLNNLSFLREQNLSMLEKHGLKHLKQVQELLDKNAFEAGIWWFSKDKEQLQKALNEGLQ